MGVIAPDDRSSADQTFLEAMEGATPLADRDRVGPAAPAVPGRSLSQQPKIQQNFTVTEDGSGRAPGVSRKLIRQLGRGQPPTSAKLDLHGYRLDNAKSRLLTFLKDSRRAGHKAALVITGRGNNSVPGGPRLRTEVPAWLAKHPDVLGFCPADSARGGDGALCVLLRNP